MDEKRAIGAVRDFLDALDIDLAAQGMEKTPERVAKMYKYLFNGVGQPTAPVWGETFSSTSAGIIAVRKIPFFSMCEHHLVPFFGEVHIAYIPHDGKIAGFSKFTSLVSLISHRPQLQERLTAEIADAVWHDLGADGVLVIAEAQQLCMTMRGDLAPDTRTLTIEGRGLLKNGSDLSKDARTLLLKGETE